MERNPKNVKIVFLAKDRSYAILSFELNEANDYKYQYRIEKKEDKWMGSNEFIQHHKDFWSKRCPLCNDLHTWCYSLKKPDNEFFEKLLQRVRIKLALKKRKV